LATETEYQAACEEAQEAVMDAFGREDWERASVARDVRWAAEYSAPATQIVRCIWDRGIACAIIHDIFGNPFHSPALDPSWLSWNNGTVAKLARAIFDERAFDRLPILADALEDAGCHDTGILAHCRGTGEHVRGCWAVDLLLGKE
jgi:hypothetical protein